MGLIIRILISAVAVFIASRIIPGIVVSDFGTALIVAIVLGLLNAFLKPILVFLTIPITILTLGLFYLVINVLMVYLAAYLVGGFAVSGFIAALLFSFVVSIVTWIIDTIVGLKFVVKIKTKINYKLQTKNGIGRPAQTGFSSSSS